MLNVLGNRTANPRGLEAASVAVDTLWHLMALFFDGLITVSQTVGDEFVSTATSCNNFFADIALSFAKEFLLTRDEARVVGEVLLGPGPGSYLYRLGGVSCTRRVLH